MNENKQYPNIIEKGYRPVGRLDTQNPPQGRSVVPSKPIVPKENKSK